MAEQLNTPKIIIILNITFVIVQRDDCTRPPFSGHLSGPKNNIEKLR